MCLGYKKSYFILLTVKTTVVDLVAFVQLSCQVANLKKLSVVWFSFCFDLILTRFLYSSSKNSMYRFASTGLTGEPIAALWVCS